MTAPTRSDPLARLRTLLDHGIENGNKHVAVQVSDLAALVPATEASHRDATPRPSECRHTPHDGRECLNIASDNDCSCTRSAPQEADDSAARVQPTPDVPTPDPALLASIIGRAATSWALACDRPNMTQEEYVARAVLRLLADMRRRHQAIADLAAVDADFAAALRVHR